MSKKWHTFFFFWDKPHRILSWHLNWILRCLLSTAEGCWQVPNILASMWYYLFIHSPPEWCLELSICCILQQDPVTRAALHKLRSVGCSAVTTACRNSLSPRHLLLTRGILTTLGVPESGWFLLPSSATLCHNEKTILSASRDWKRLLTYVCLSLGKGAIGWEQQIRLWLCLCLKGKP